MKQLEFYATKAATATSNFKTASYNGYRWCFLYSVLRKENLLYKCFFLAEPLYYLTYVKFKALVA